MPEPLIAVPPPLPTGTFTQPTARAAEKTEYGRDAKSQMSQIVCINILHQIDNRRPGRSVTALHAPIGAEFRVQRNVKKDAAAKGSKTV